jgi:hypothetical protein
MQALAVLVAVQVNHVPGMMRFVWKEGGIPFVPSSDVQYNMGGGGGLTMNTLVL